MTTNIIFVNLDKMRMILYFLTLILLIGCNKNNNNEVLIKLSKDVGFIENLSENEILFLNKIDKNDVLNENEIKKIKEKLIKLDKSAKKYQIKKTNIKGYYEVKAENDTFYINEEATHMFIGQAVTINENGVANFISESDITKKRRKLLGIINKKELIIKKSENAIETLFVFTDITCPFCKKFHKDINKINELGYEIVYIPYSRDNNNQEIKNTMNKIWCSKKMEEYTKAINNEIYIKTNKNNKECKNFTDYYINIANEMEIIGTPFILTSKGVLLGGYQNYSSFLMSLNRI